MTLANETGFDTKVMRSDSTKSDDLKEELRDTIDQLPGGGMARSEKGTFKGFKFQIPKTQRNSTKTSNSQDASSTGLSRLEKGTIYAKEDQVSQPAKL